MTQHEKYISRCIQLSKSGLGTTRPNPMVGCVVVHDDTIIGEGFTSPYGGNHAEVNAIESVENKELLVNSIIYVSLEPCSHFGKTPPCAHLIVKSKIPKVVIGVIDDNELVGGKGVQYLKDNGCEVVVGVLEDECKEVNKRFFTYHNKKRPYIILKWAESKDGFIDEIRKEDAEKKPTWISNGYSQQLVHKWRSEEHAILVGTNTVITDNPKLNVRKWVGQDPVRVVLDNSMRIPHDFHVFDGSIKTIVFTSSKSHFEDEKENVVLKYIDYTKSVPNQICKVLYENNIQSMIVEGGAQTLLGFLNEDLWDEARIFVGDKVFGEGLSAPNIEGVLCDFQKVGSDIIKIIKPRN
ncbi:bifunctional diaminohydroxyphosphoribosylaminopyrimidine deaminase/5-amino-6-(5-phosphoribosylamino)uracil reductase RibD [Urechidicola croceus]|uniref:Riboflavin biosynthesis protein RibD n=1 Tax=Urechidicola croceus TaxID=1850246 RepID=A0A1D8PBJ3_9FLAO|nr:bifunctional diaminohydroxyphosphoribosylaminopyrimidine deaminase/5-amino-6-(5-phosphoribosylamino)uracil reductase RibD [Urechidicola croceus]AOW21949.1 riboflavin biosynthesis protein RibD [Urechidicola croceus]